MKSKHYSKTKLIPNNLKPKVEFVFKGDIADVCGIRNNLTFHIARHAFATTVLLSNGVPIETVSKLLGHTKLSTTQIYARVVETKISEDINNLQERIKKREVTKISANQNNSCVV
ncbi:tyrosine-type recombinase/integrase [Mariniflexile litorale]|uniref:Tyrosine-type recombinase/integrase n=1 Tax=Mariniflexile litorale TaxID=3045158 RepID=A0AAU7EKY3_9FLAO|nr:tyrosine-type recombinase/integrase [Mariniflexile sp. KMM 9835]